MGISFIPRPGDHVSSTLGSISNTLVDLDLSNHMCEKERDGQIAASIGSTNTLQLQCISDSEPETKEQKQVDSTCNDDDDSFATIFNLDDDRAHERVDEFFSHSTSASRPRGVTPEHLSKIWRILQDDARRMINTTTQTSVRTQDPRLSCNYGTNDRML